MNAPLIVVVAHRKVLDTPLGEQLGSMVYDGYLDNLRRAGAAVVIASPGTPVPDAVVQSMDGLLLTGGGDVSPASFGSDETGSAVDLDRDTMETELVTHCREHNVPVLGICRGNQMLNVALGGTLKTVSGHVQEQPLHDPVHGVELVAGCRLADLVGEAAVKVNSFHRWAVDRPAGGMRVAARSDHGDIEGIEWDGDDWFAVGAQWHAELMTASHVQRLFTGFVDAARRRQ